MGCSIALAIHSLDRCPLFGFPPGLLRAGAQGIYYRAKIPIAFPIWSVDLSTRLIAPYKAMAYYGHDFTNIRRFSVHLLRASLASLSFCADIHMPLLRSGIMQHPLPTDMALRWSARAIMIQRNRYAVNFGLRH